jgi:hypothetical protein
MYLYDKNNWGDYSGESESESESDYDYVPCKEEEVKAAFIAPNQTFQNPCDKKWKRNVSRLQEVAQNSEYIDKTTKMWERSSSFDRVNAENKTREKHKTGKVPVTLSKACKKNESVNSRIISKCDTSVPWARIVQSNR